MFPTFNLTQENIDKSSILLKQEIQNAQEVIDELLQIDSKTYANFIRPLSKISDRLELLFTPISHLNYVDNSKKSEKIYSELLDKLTTFDSNINQNIDIYNAFKEIESEDGLNSEQKRVIRNRLQEFTLGGVNLQKDKKDRLKVIDLELSRVQTTFAQNLLQATDNYKLEVSYEDIKDFPESDLESAKDGDRYIVTLKQPSYIATMTYSNNKTLREKIYRAYVTRSPENEELIEKILSLRDEKAKILGFNNYTQLSLETKMASSQSDVIEFLNSLASSSRKAAKSEYERLKEFAEVKSLEPWDISYYSNKLKKELYDIDDQEYMPYFEKSRTLGGLFVFLKEMFDIEFQKVETKTWHESVEVYDIYEDSRVFARVYCDLESREAKRGGAWMNNWVTHHMDEDKRVLPSAFIVCNFLAKSKNTPSLLRPNDVITLFHEMGHAIHHLFSKVAEVDISGIHGVEWDGVEFPSQFLENFAYEEEVLKRFAKHYKSGKVLPTNMIKKLKDAKNYQSAMMMLRQVEFALFDIKIHLSNYNSSEVQNILDEVRRDVAITTYPKYNKFQNSFSHIFAGGYAAGYYSYKWAEVLSADAFLKFIDGDIFSRDLAKKYRDEILRVGGSRSMLESFRAFSNKEPDPNSLLKLVNI
jgi:oligopeptidase A